jgi:glycosyltransferase 2 family protein
MSALGKPIFNKKQEEILSSIKMSRVILPMLIGVGVVFYLLYQQFDPEEFSKIPWSLHTLFWLLMSLVFVVLRHLAYAARIKWLSEGAFTWKKAIELIFIWEFSSAVTPTSVGGSAVALFALSQEKIPPAKTTAIVLYTVVLDTIFFVGTLPVLMLLFGPEIIRPGLTSFSNLGPWGITFLTAYVIMLSYGAFFFYGLFINPNQLKRTAAGITSLPYLRRWKRQAIELGNNFILASKELKAQNRRFHLKVFGATAAAWIFKFTLINCIIIALVSALDTGFLSQLKLYSRLEAMFIIMAFSPTPGGSGFAEFVFGGFLSDYVPKGIALVVASVWRLFTYYSYLLAGVIIIPAWLNKLISDRIRARALHKAESAIEDKPQKE